MLRRDGPKSGRMDKPRRGSRKHMGYRQQFSGSPWEHGGPNFGMNHMGMPGHMMNNFGPGFGGNPMAFGGPMAHQGMMGGFGKNQGGFGGMSFGGNMGLMGNVGGMGVGYMNAPNRQGNRMRGGFRQNFARNQMMPRKRPPMRNLGGPRNKRFAPDSEARSRSKQRRDRRPRDSREGGRPDYRKDRRHKEKKSDDDDDDDDDKDEDGELYNPAEPTQDASDQDSEGADGEQAEGQEDGDDEKKEKGDEDKDGESKAEDGDKAKGEDGSPKKTEKEGGKGEKGKGKGVLQVTIQHGTKGRSVKDKQGSGGSSKKLFCHACKLTCTTQEKFRNHMNSKGHKMRMETLLVLQREKTHVLEARMKASEHLRMIEMRDSSRRGKGSRRGGNWCTVCESSFPGSFLVHRRTKEHRRKRDKKYPKCRPCRLGFSNQDDYKEHCATDDHKQKSAEFYAIRGQSPGSGSDDDDDYVTVDATGIFEDDDEDEKMNEKDHSDDGDEKTEEGGDGKSKEKEPVGQTYVIPIEGFYCKLCRKYFKDQNTAKVLHCRAYIHISNYKYKLKALEKEKREKEAAEARRKKAEKAKESTEAATKKEADTKQEDRADTKQEDGANTKQEDGADTKQEDGADAKPEEEVKVKEDAETASPNEDKADSQEVENDTDAADKAKPKSAGKSGDIEMIEAEDELAKDLEETAEATEGQVISSLVSESSEQENSELVASLSSQIVTEPPAASEDQETPQDESVDEPGEDEKEEDGGTDEAEGSKTTDTSPQAGGKAKGLAARGRGRARGKGKRQ